MGNVLILFGVSRGIYICHLCILFMGNFADILETTCACTSCGDYIPSYVVVIYQYGDLVNCHAQLGMDHIVAQITADVVVGIFVVRSYCWQLVYLYMGGE